MKKISLILTICLLASAAMAQKTGKWTSLFDGKSTKGWHAYRADNAKKWMVMSGALMTHGGSGDLVSDKEYGDFEMEFDFKIPPKANSGVIYKVVEDPKNATYFSGPEYQIIDDENYPPLNDGGKMVKINDRQKTGANYDMQAPGNLKATKPAGEWNKGRIKIKDNHVEHWLNGEKVVDYVYGSDDWKAQLAKSKFSKWAYATPHARGKIALQDHGDEVWFKNMRIREL
ncbi:DUF1080 domain-containing protein [Persicitalea sp.]|uniref:3-keto-disaccharide hydrolase n=1 Tax=Persicitalea sp. TaxID=3100273 RepID=UPI003593CDED